MLFIFIVVGVVMPPAALLTARSCLDPMSTGETGIGFLVAYIYLNINNSDTEREIKLLIISNPIIDKL